MVVGSPPLPFWLVRVPSGVLPVVGSQPPWGGGGGSALPSASLGDARFRVLGKFFSPHLLGLCIQWKLGLAGPVSFIVVLPFIFRSSGLRGLGDCDSPSHHCRVVVRLYRPPPWLPPRHPAYASSLAGHSSIRFQDLRKARLGRVTVF